MNGELPHAHTKGVPQQPDLDSCPPLNHVIIDLVSTDTVTAKVYLL